MSPPSFSNHLLLHLNLIGGLLVALALLHFGFPRRFGWKTELRTLSPINRQMMEVHTFFVALTVGLMGVLCLTSAPELLGTPLGRKVCLGLTVFWSVRLVAQFGWYSSELWRGKRFETVMHVLFSLLWLYLSGVFWLGYARGG